VLPLVFVLLALWVVVAAVVLGACRAAATGDAQQRRRDAHWGSLAR
jgi:hypothetical protein